MSSHITRYDLMPIPPVEAQTKWFEAGVLRFGVEYRLVNDAITAASEMSPAKGDNRPPPGSIDDRGVSIHVVGVHEGDLISNLTLSFNGSRATMFDNRDGTFTAMIPTGCGY